MPSNIKSPGYYTFSSRFPCVYEILSYRDVLFKYIVDLLNSIKDEQDSGRLTKVKTTK